SVMAINPTTFPSGPEIFFRATSTFGSVMKFSSSEAKDKFPPLSVFHVGDQYILVDGFHRVAAAKKPVRDQAGWALQHVKKRPEVIAALILSANTDPNKVLRANAVGYLSSCGGPAEQLVPLGLRFLQSEDGYDRWQGALLLRDYQSVSE